MSGPGPAVLRAHQADAARVGEWLEAVAALAASRPAGGEAFLLVTPLGWPARRWLEAELEAAGLAPSRRLALPGFAAVSTAVQARGRDEASLRRAAAFEAAWRRHFPRDHGEAWAFPAGAHHRRAVAMKPWLRRRLREARVGAGLEALPWPAPALHPFHLPDLGDAEAEARRLEAALLLLPAQPPGLTATFGSPGNSSSGTVTRGLLPALTG